MFLVIGTSTLDLVVSGFDTLPKVEGDEFTADSLVFCDQPLRMMPGGNGANSAYVLARLGASPSLYSAIGCDKPGDILFEWLSNAGVNLQWLIRSKDINTSSTTMISDKDHNRLSFHHHGASGEFGPKDLADDLPAGITNVLITGYPLLTRWRKEDMGNLLERFQSSGCTLFLDIGPTVGTPMTLEELSPFLALIDYLLCNEHEFLKLTGVQSIEEAITGVQFTDVDTVIVKQGARGAHIISKDTASTTLIEGFDVKSDITVGAGDSFNAGLLYEFSKGALLEQAVRFANAVAAMVVASGSGVLGAPLMKDVEQFMESKFFNRERSD